MCGVSARAQRKSPASAPLAGSVGVRWRAATLLLSGLLAYANALSAPFLLDDYVSIVDNPPIRAWSQLGRVLAPGRELPTAGRPLVNFSFAVNYALGGLDVRGYHMFNVACHVLCGLLLFGIVRRTLELPSLQRDVRASPANLALTVAMLWMLHPLNTEAVNYLTQRTELMMALFYLLTIYAAIRARGARARVWQVVAVLSCVAGMACKESMATVPVIVVLYDAIFVFGSPRRAFAARWRFYAALGAAWFVLGALMLSGPRAHSAGFSSGVNPWTYLLNQTVVITRYLGLSIWPRSLVTVYGWPVALTLRDVLPYAVFVMALFAVAAFVLIRRPTWGFLGAWFFITLAPTSSIVPIATEVGAERRMYLPLMALVVVAVVGGSVVLRAAAPRVIAAVAVASFAFMGTTIRNRDYASPLVLARTSVERYPTSVGHHVLGDELITAGDRESAVIELRRAVPGAPRAHYTLGTLLLKDERTISEGIDQLRLFLRAQPMLLEAVHARLMLAQALAKQQRWSEAIEEGAMVLRMNPSPDQRLGAHELLAAAFRGADRFEDAIVQCRDYLRLRPDTGPMLTQLGIALVATGKFDEAIAPFRRVVDLDPQSVDAHRNLATALYDQGNYVEAVTEAEHAVVLRPTDADAQHLLGRALAQLGRFDEAMSHFERALQANPDHGQAKEDLNKLRVLTRRRS